MSWMMPAETAPQSCTWMIFPCPGNTLGNSQNEAQQAYDAWSNVANTIAQYQPVKMVVNPGQMERARVMLSADIELIPQEVDEFWMRDVGPTFVVNRQDSTILGAVDWVFNGWGDQPWAQWQKSARIGAFVAQCAGAERISSCLVNEGGAIHVDGRGSVLVTETVQLDPRRNLYLDQARVEGELERTLGVEHVVWVPRGLYRDSQEFGTNGHIDMVATICDSGVLLIHEQQNPNHPDHAIMATIQSQLEHSVDAQGLPWEVIALPAPETIRDQHDFVDWSYVNHLVINHAVVSCGFGEPQADATAREILAQAYPGREIVTLDARAIFARGGGIHCITQQQPEVGVIEREC